MIQRIQTLLLMGVAILLTVNLFVPIWTNTQAKFPIVLDAFTISYTTPENPLLQATLKSQNVYYIAILIMVCLILTFITILLYKNRGLQIRLCNLLTVLTLMIIGSYFIAIPAAKSMMVVASDGNYNIGYFLPIISVLLILAARYYINKDEALVRSVDRIR